MIDSILSSSVVQIIVTSRIPEPRRPWNCGPEQHFSATGCLIDKGRILTAAHVVSHCVSVRVRKNGESKEYPARVTSVDYERELAIVHVEDVGFLDGLSPARIGHLPETATGATVIAFRRDDLNVLTGSIVKVACQTYVHSRRFLLAIEIEMPVTLGFSGAPVFAHGQLIGLIFQGYPDGNASAIPVPLIKCFLRDSEDGIIQGVPELGVFWQRLQNQDLISYLGLDNRDVGVLVSRVVRGSSADGLLQPGDVITAIDGVEVTRDAMVMVDGKRLHFTHVISRRQVGENVVVALHRNGCTHRCEIPLKAMVALVPVRPFESPRFLVYAGLVMVPMTYEYMVGHWPDKVSFNYLHNYYDSLPGELHAEVVILADIIQHEVNEGYEHMRGVVVERVNGIPITRMSDLCEALTRPLNGWHVIEIDNHGERAEPIGDKSYGTLIVMNASRAAEAHTEILSEHAIVFDRSQDLR